MTGMEIRRAVGGDEEAILSLASRTLGWLPDEHHAAFFRWKHFENPFGASPMWVAIEGDRLAGFRTFLRWRWASPDGSSIESVRAVDTATHPDFQGRGVFTRLTLAALDELASEGVGFVFNTPNDQSRPGYLKMGWQVVGRVPIRLRPRSVLALARLARSRVPADMWSQPLAIGAPGSTINLGRERDDRVLRTEKSAEFLRWRYGFPALDYRVVEVGSTRLVVRRRRRGAASELVICDVIDGAPTDSELRELLRSAEVDYAVATSSAALPRMVPLPRQGPVLTWRGLAAREMPALDQWRLDLGDIELL